MSFPCLLLVSCLLVDVEADRQARADLKWAKSVAADFLEAVTTGQTATAWGLLSPELARSVSKQDGYHFNGVGAYRDARITSEAVSPSGNEMVFEGILIGRNETIGDATFRLRVARDGKDGLWRVRFLSLKERPNK
jgi:hypothetical protein